MGGKNNRLAYGLCKEHGIKLPKGATPKQAWYALRKRGYIDSENKNTKNSNNPLNLITSVGGNTPNNSDDVEVFNTFLRKGAKPFTKEEIEDNVKLDRSFTKADRPTCDGSNAAAEKILIKADEVEPQITADIINICESAGGSLCGLKWRKKGLNSLSGKINSEYEDKRKFNTSLTYEDCSKGMKDVVRYTSVVAEEDMDSHVDKVFSSLTKKGYKIVKCKNTFKENAQYKGLNCNIATPDGYIFELQFHNPASINNKEHQVYDKEAKEWRPANNDEKISEFPCHHYYEEARILVDKDPKSPAEQRRLDYLEARLRYMNRKIGNHDELDETCKKYIK